MEKRLKKCKGFEDERLCKRCKRLDKTADKRLINEIRKVIGGRYCMHYVFKKR
ncbi:MAG: hypothetical protein PF487_00135 [Bacteroidales bacterium]|jgi:hypothetical protein|nr:hypothetical protein [Bacteroidales bacterium]